MAAHDLFQHVEPAHARHLKIKGDHLRFQFFDFLKAEVAIHGSAYNLDGVVGLQNLRNELPHQSGVVNHQHAYRLCAHWRTSAALLLALRETIADCATWVPVFAKRSITAARFMIRTTRPSPRTEAPLTKSVATV